VSAAPLVAMAAATMSWWDVVNPMLAEYCITVDAGFTYTGLLKYAGSW
jgi:hypothetical protein